MKSVCLVWFATMLAAVPAGADSLPKSVLCWDDDTSARQRMGTVVGLSERELVEKLNRTFGTWFRGERVTRYGAAPVYSGIARYPRGGKLGHEAVTLTLVETSRPNDIRAMVDHEYRVYFDGNSSSSEYLFTRQDENQAWVAAGSIRFPNSDRSTEILCRESESRSAELN